jgi:hypothetical protein
MGIFDIFKKSRREIIRENQSKGKEGEEHIRRKYEFNGYKVERTGKGHDFKAERKDWLTGKKETKYIEVKTGNSKLSDLQRKKKRQYGRSKYVEERLDHTPFGLVSQDDAYRVNNLRSKRKNDYSFGSGLDNMFGTGPSGKRSRRNDNYGFGSGLNDMFGTGSSGRRKRNSSDSWAFGF